MSSSVPTRCTLSRIIILNPLHSASCPCYSTQSALFKIIHDLQSAIDNQQILVLLSFGTVDPPISFSLNYNPSPYPTLLFAGSDLPKLPSRRIVITGKISSSLPWCISRFLHFSYYFPIVQLCSIFTSTTFHTLNIHTSHYLPMTLPFTHHAIDDENFEHNS